MRADAARKGPRHKLSGKAAASGEKHIENLFSVSFCGRVMKDTAVIYQSVVEAMMTTYLSMCLS